MANLVDYRISAYIWACGGKDKVIHACVVASSVEHARRKICENKDKVKTLDEGIIYEVIDNEPFQVIPFGRGYVWSIDKGGRT